MKTIYTGLLTTITIVGLSSFSWGQCFNAPTVIKTGSESISPVVVADFNGDGKSDLLRSAGNTISVVPSYGDGTFGSAISSGVGRTRGSLIAGDVNGDGKSDLVGADTDTVSVFLNDGNGRFSLPVNTAAYFDDSRNPAAIAVADFNSDGKLDLVTVTFFTSTVSVLLGDGQGAFGVATNYYLGDVGNSKSMVVGDFNGDGRPDVATVNANSGRVSVLLNNRDGRFGPVTNYYVGATPAFLLTGDVDSDGKPDLITVHYSPFGNYISVLIGVGNGTFTGGPVTSLNTSVDRAVVSDFNNDGKLDLAIIGYFIFVKLGDGAGRFGPETRFTFNATTGPSGAENPGVSIAFGDFNVDGKTDLATVGYTSPTTADYYNFIAVLLNCSVAPASTNLSLAPPTYDCTTGQLTAQTTGDNGQPVEYRIAGLRDWAASNVFTVPTYQRSGTTFTIEARQGGIVTSLPFTTTCQTTIPTTPTTPIPPTTTGLSLAQPAYDCNSGQLALSTTGGNGSLAEYRVAGLRDWANSNTFTVPAYQRMGTSFTLEARQSGLVVSLPFTATCQTTPPATNQPLSVSALPLNCQTGALQLVTTGGDGTPIDYKVPGLGNYSPSPTFTVPTYQRMGTTFTLYARQSGREVTTTYAATCPVGSRLASAETSKGLSVVVYPNPVGEEFRVGVSGAAGQSVRFHLTNLSGQTVIEQRAQVVSDAHTETMKLPASGAGLYLLQVSTGSESKTVKVLKP